MWRFAVIHSNFKLWFSDGKPVGGIRGSNGVSSRLIVDRQGFLDLTELQLSGIAFLDINGSWLWSREDPEHAHLPVELSLSIAGDGAFTVGLLPTSQSRTLDIYSPTMTASGKLKPLPDVSAHDAAFIDDMIAQKYLPYQNIPDAPGKTVEEIRALGQTLFPFSSYNFQLAMCVYDWTTASFTRMVFLKIFQYTGIQETPFPIDQPNIATQIWKSNWGPYTPSNVDYMNSFMMKPASSLEGVKAQLDVVAPKLHMFSNVQNRLLAAAMQALPRTSIIAQPHLFSGQMDISQLGLDDFGIEFLECPLNKGPVSESLTLKFATTMASYVAKGNIITTKMVWSFTDSIQDAIHYANGILLVANRPDDSWVWETATYVTTLSDDPHKTEYAFMPGSRFEVKSVEQVTVQQKPVVVITLQPQPIEGAGKRFEVPVEVGEVLRGPLEVQDVAGLAAAYTPTLEQHVQLIDARTAVLEGASIPGAIELHRSHPSLTHFKLGHKTGGRRCACIDVVDSRLDL